MESCVAMEEKQKAFALRRSAGPWASELISAADFLRFIGVCRLASEGLAMLTLWEPRERRPASRSGRPALEDHLWRSISDSFQLGEDGFLWLQREAPAFLEEAKATLGELQEPSDEKLKTLLRTNKPSLSRPEQQSSE